eukprot:4859829-Pyramimonas_sp.AAC.1
MPRGCHARRTVDSLLRASCGMAFLVVKNTTPRREGLADHASTLFRRLVVAACRVDGAPFPRSLSLWTGTKP